MNFIEKLLLPQTDKPMERDPASYGSSEFEKLLLNESSVQRLMWIYLAEELGISEERMQQIRDKAEAQVARVNLSFQQERGRL